MRILISISLEEAKELVSKKELVKLKNIGHSKEVIDTLINYEEDNIGCDGSLVFGVSKIENNSVSLARDFSSLPAYVPFKSGRFILEIEKPNDECICIPLEELQNIERSVRKAESDKLKELYSKKVEPLLTLGSSYKNPNEACVVFGVRYKDCKYFKYITDTWEEGSKKLGDIPEAKVEHLEVFDVCN